MMTVDRSRTVDGSCECTGCLASAVLTWLTDRVQSSLSPSRNRLNIENDVVAAFIYRSGRSQHEMIVIF